MDHKTLDTLEFFRIKEQIGQYTLSHLGKKHVDEMEPLTNVKTINRLQEEVAEAAAAVQSISSVPIPTMDGLPAALSHMDKGLVLTKADAGSVSRFLKSIEQLQQFMARKEEQAPNVAGYARSLDSLPGVRGELDRCVTNEWVNDEASTGLAKVRKKVRIVQERLKKKLDSTLKKYSKFLQDDILTERAGRTVLSVQRAHKKMVPGVTVDQSSSGQTLFIEPADVASLEQDLLELRATEEMEADFVLQQLTSLVRDNRHSLDLNIEITGQYDFLFAKARFAKAVGGRTVALNTEGIVRVRGGRHPLLGYQAVPLDFSIGDKFSVLVITGPNTGGKTVSLKTIGLLTLMVQSGLMVPVEQGSEFAVFHQVLADIGDGQSIDQSLSTFSAHVKSVIDILEQASRNTLILMDELATGTDPGEGIGLSISVLDALYRRGSTVVATTHFNEIKEFAKQTKGFENARMEFDTDTLRPLYKLKIGEAGNSYAFEIALKLGMPAEIVERSRLITRDTAQLQGPHAVRKHVDDAPDDLETAPTDAGGAPVGAECTPADAGGVPADAKTAPAGAKREAQGAKKTDECGAVTLGRAAEGREAKGGEAEGREVKGREVKGREVKGGEVKGGEVKGGEVKGGEVKGGEVNGDDTEIEKKKPLQIGDRVWINSLKQTGIVYSLPDDRGNMTVVVQRKRMTLNHKRVSPYLSREQLYPENYNLDIVLESKEHRRKRTLMTKHHVQGLAIEHDANTVSPKLKEKDRWM
ncbi:DNA mismatch repair protein MutS [Alicyclobacillus sp. SO9]|uniref:endonuclease MutS2 n=1 Tax=Alicyclobacillus sp. SO9 TaxID=2665646 RepID=UPI0018E8B081|nr:DNA mismatch repair protein MutS [Alicyclobacillus sp. SO9]QQE80366.1 DNA mismatch repair protein MutS [Alicyclobacillus sp. SO9]